MQKIGKEIKIGLAVIGVLVAAFGYILFRRLSRPDDLPPPAASAPAAAAAPAASSDKPTVVSATESGRPADATADGGSSSRSLFSTPHRPQPSDSADMGTEARGSFLPAANSAESGNGYAASGTPASGSATANTASTGGAPGDSGNSAAPENRFSQFGRRQHADAAKTDSPTATSTQNAAATDGGHSRFTSGNSAPPAEPAATTAAPSSFGAGAASADPFQHKSAPPAEPTPTQPATSLSGNLPAHQASSAGEPAESNPLRQSHDPAAQTAPPAAHDVASPDVVSSDANRSSFGTNNSAPAASDTVPPPVTSSAINVPSQYSTPSEPVSMSPPLVTTQPMATSQPIAPAQPISAGQPVGNSALPTSASPSADAPVHRPGQYVVQANDNYWTISEKVYGAGGYFKAVYEHNRRQHAQSDRLQVGDVLDVPEAAVLEQMYPELCPKPAGDRMSATAAATTAAAPTAAPPGTRIYSVADGDTLYEIARRELGEASRWGEIYQLNHDQLGNDFGYLRPGARLLLPADSGATSMAREPSAHDAEVARITRRYTSPKRKRAEHPPSNAPSLTLRACVNNSG